MAEVNVKTGIKKIEVYGQITRADGTREDNVLLGYYERDDRNSLQKQMDYIKQRAKVTFRTLTGKA